MSDTGSFERQTVSIMTVIKWAGGLATAIVFITAIYFRLEAMERATTNLEQSINAAEARIRNLEEHVIWRHE